MGLSHSAVIRLETQLEALPLLMGKASPDAITRRPASGKWSAHENLAHLGRHHEVFIERVQRILAEDRP
ncbi:MAG: DinB family protein, partial [candidate division NC10 bacterium]